MKARINEKQSISSNDIILSISMIVKNEEKYIGGCLEALSPLLKNVKSEVIVVDTGSTDKTVEIASKYTDKIYHFDWINDFAAARNFGLSKCSGAWFMSIDADEHFSDVSEFIEFFGNYEINRKYKSGYFIVRNYETPKLDKFFDFYVQRIALKTGDLHYKGAIHESFGVLYTPSYFFKSYANHYGYAFETPEQRNNKISRNMALLSEELKKQPDDLRTLFHYISCIIDPEEKKTYIEKAYKLAKRTNDSIYISAYFNAIELYLKSEPDKSLEIINDFIGRAAPDDAVLTEAYALMSIINYEKKNYEETVSSIRKYLSFYKKHLDNKLNLLSLARVSTNYINEKSYWYFLTMLSSCYGKQEKLDDAFGVFDKTDFISVPSDSYKNITDTLIDISEKNDKYDLLICFYEKIYKTRDKDKTAYLERKLEELYYRCEKLAESFKSHEGDFAELMSLVMFSQNQTEKLQSFINKFNPLPEGYSKAVYLALKRNIDLTNALEKMDYELLREHISIVAKNNSDLPSIAIRYQDLSFFMSNIKNLLFGVLLFEASLHNYSSLAYNDKSKLFKCFSDCTSLYVCNVYNPALLNETDIKSLPQSHRFGYFISLAQKELDAGNNLGYIKTLKNALLSCKSMKDVIVFILDEFTKTNL